MRKLHTRGLAMLGLVCLALFLTASPIWADPGNGNGNAGGTGNGQNGNGNAFGHDNQVLPAVSATPELDSLLLFGTGAAGMVGYGLMRLRARRRDKTQI